MKKIPRPHDDLIRELNEQLELLSYCSLAFDSGFVPIAKPISAILRSLLHVGGRSRALLKQVNLHDGEFLASARSIDARNLLPSCGLVGARTVANAKFGSATYVPLCQMGGGPMAPRMVPFIDWWTSNVMKDAKGSLFSREQLVLHVAETDGGVHVDPALDKAYVDMSRLHGLGWIIGHGPFDPGSEWRPPPIAGRLELACVRQIAWEVLETLRIRYGGSLRASSSTS